MLRLITAFILAFVFHGGARFVSAEPLIVYQAQTRSVEAEARVQSLEYTCEDDQGEDIQCPPRIDRDSRSATDFSPFDVIAEASETWDCCQGASAIVRQNSSLSPNGISATMSFFGRSSAGGTGTFDWSMGSQGVSSLSIEFRLSSPALVRLSVDLSAVHYGIDYEDWGQMAYVRLTTESGNTIFDPLLPPTMPLDRQLETTYVLPVGNFQLDALVRAHAIPSAAYGTPGRIEMSFALNVEGLSVPEPTGKMLLLGAIATTVGLANRRWRGQFCRPNQRAV